MKTLFTFLAIALLSCNKENSNRMSEETQPLKAIPTASVNGKTITLSADQSTGPVVRYGWALDVSSPTDGGVANPIKFSPDMSHKGSDFIPITATVTKTGKYSFSLMVYDAEGKSDYATVQMEVK